MLSLLWISEIDHTMAQIHLIQGMHYNQGVWCNMTAEWHCTYQITKSCVICSSQCRKFKWSKAVGNLKSNAVVQEVTWHLSWLQKQKVKGSGRSVKDVLFPSWKINSWEQFARQWSGWEGVEPEHLMHVKVLLKLLAFARKYPTVFIGLACAI